MRKYKRKKGKSISKAKKYTYRGIEYKSGLELYAAKRFEEEQIFVQYEPIKFILQDSFYMIDELYERQSNGKGEFKKRGGKKVLPLTYRPDFIGGNFCCETKGYAGEAFPIRWKLFKKMICDNYEGELLIFKPQNRKEVDKMIEIILSKEIWKDVKGFEERYKISNYGRVKSISKSTAKILKSFKTGSKNSQYLAVDFEGGVKNNKIHQLVAEHFIDNPNMLETINHIDENTFNNNVNNLQRLSREDNIIYSHSKPLSQYDKNNNFIRDYSGASEAVQYGFSHQAIINCASGRSKTSGGYKWKYK